MQNSKKLRDFQKNPVNQYKGTNEETNGQNYPKRKQGTDEKLSIRKHNDCTLNALTDILYLDAEKWREEN